MKNLFTILATVISLNIGFAQDGPAFGFKAGLNYNGNGNYIESIQDNVENPDRNIGFHAGFFGKFGNALYFRPELVFTSTKSDYDSGKFNMQKLDAPLLIGVKLVGPLSVFGGPSLQYILNSKFNDNSSKNIDKDLTVGVNFGAAINFNKFAIDLRYERGLNKNEASFLGNNGIDVSDRIDTRANQLILSFSAVF
ncbi:MAG: PorT family protein [Bacteroidetes bacterium]|nr:PorT family protein [Bacteroidota bacterium]